MPASPTVAVRILGDAAGANKAMQENAGVAASSGVRITSAYRGVFAELNKSGILGPFGDAISGVDAALTNMHGTARTTGAVLMGTGAAVGVAGRALSDLGSKETASQQQLKTAVEATGKSYDDYKDKLESAAQGQAKYGHSAAETNDALRTLTMATKDPAKAMQELQVASDLAAAKHESLGKAATSLGKAYNGNTKILKEYGITVDKTSDSHKILDTATKETEKADKAAADAKKKLGDIEEQYQGKTKLTVSEQQRLRDAQDKVTATSMQQASAHKNLSQAQENMRTATSANAKAVDELGQRLSGQAAAASSTFTGRIKAISTEAENMAAKIGQKAGPAIQGVGTAMVAAGGAMEVWGAHAQRAAKAAADGEKATKGLTEATKAQTVAQRLLNIVTAMNPWILVAIAIAALVVGLIELYKHSQLVREIVAAMGHAFMEFANIIKTVIVDAVQFIIGHWKLLAAALLILLGPIGIVAAAFLLFHNQIIGFVEGVVKTIAALPGRILAAVAGFGSLLVNAGSSLIQGLIHGITGALGGIESIVGGIGGKILHALGDVGSILFNAGKSIIEGLGKGIESALGGVLDKVSGIAGKIASLKGPLDADYRLLQPAGREIMAGLSYGLMSGFAGSVSGTLRGITAAIGGTSVPSLYVGTGATSAGANVAGGRGAPVVVIENLHVSTELDVEAFMKRVAWVAQTSGL